MPKLDKNGHEIVDPKPMALPVGFKRPETLAEQVARLVRSQHLADAVAAAGYETFEEADDFDIPDDPIDPSTPYEHDFDHAAIAAINHGVVAEPDYSAGKGTLEKLKKKLTKKKAAKAEKLSKELLDEDDPIPPTPEPKTPPTA